MEETFALHVNFEGNNDTPEIFRLPTETAWCDLEAMLQAQYDCTTLEIIYIDTEGDYITLSSQEELREAHKVARQCSNTLHLKVRDLGNSQPFAPPNDDRHDNIVNEADTVPLPPNTDDIETEVKLAPVVPEMIRDTNDSTTAPSQLDIEREVEESANRLSEVVIHVDKATGEVTGTKPEQKEITPVQKPVRDEETGATFTKDEQPVVKKKKRDPMEDSYRRVSQSADRATKSRRRAYDSDSGETAEDDGAMPYGVFIRYMEELKKELHCEIVKDVTRKTVKQVLKGLDGAVIQTLKGSEGGSSDPITTALPKNDLRRMADPNSSHPVYYHTGVICSFCEQGIYGARYKCCNCADYNLCEECEAIHGVHDSTHVFIKLRKPIKLQKRTPLMKNILYKMYMPAPFTQSEEDQLAMERRDDILTTEDRAMVQEKIIAKIEKLQAKGFRKQEKIRQKEEKWQEKQRRKEERLKRRLESRRDEPMKREKLDLPGRMDSLHLFTDLKSSFLYDVTIPDGTKVQPGTKLVKTWKLRNTGRIPWRETTKLHNVYGSIPTPTPDVDVPLLHPGEVADISVQLQAPEMPGKYQSHWKLLDSGYQFGHRVWCEIVVEPKQVLEPTRSDSLKLLSEAKTIQEEPEEDQEQVNDQASIQQTETEIKLKQETIGDDFVIEKSLEERDPKDYEVVTVEGETEEEKEEREDVKTSTEDQVAKVEQDLSTAAAAVAQLRLDHQTVSNETGQNLVSFEMLDLVTRGTAKVSQTATPNNTPLLMSPPKSPAPELVAEKSLSRSSSVELVSAENEEEEEPVHLDHQYVQECMNSLSAPKPADVIEDDQISYQSLSSSDESMSEDEDFLIVPMPACFDTSKPLKMSREAHLSETDEETNTDDNHNTIPTPDQQREVSVDEILTASNSLTTPPLDPMVAIEPPALVNDASLTDTATEQTAPAEGEVIVSSHEVPAAETSSGEDEIGASGDVDILPTNTETGELSATNTAIHVHSDPIDQDHTEVKEPQPEVNNNGNVASGENEEKEQPQGATASDESTAELQDNRPSEIVNQVMSTAVKAANRAAATAYTTCKEVFYTWQARTYHNGSGTQPPQKWQQKQEKFVPPKSTWKPKGDTWVPPQSTWTPSQGKESGPIGKLLEMGFCNREENTKLLEKHNDNVVAVVQELLGKTDNNWASSRH